MDTTEQRLDRYIRQRLRLLKWELKTLESLADEERKSVPYPPEQGRYLCVSFGFTIFCIDLMKKSIDADDPKQLLQIPPIQLLQEGLPISMGLFKLNSHTYMVGGQEFSGVNDNNPNPWDLRLFHFLYYTFGVKGSSRDTYHLSLPEDTLSLRLTQCDFIGPLNKPKVWPIIERIGDKIHVIESLPRTFCEYFPHTVPSHEVLDCQDIGRGWVELSPVCFPMDEYGNVYSIHTWIHIVVGDRIYARPHLSATKFMVFESKTSEWKLCDYESGSEYFSSFPYYPLPRPSSINHVSQILQFGCGRCFATSLYYGESSTADILYVLIALVFDDDMKMTAEAYLVTSKGQILCFQPLPDIFEKFGRPFEGREPRLINVDEHTMCAVLHGITGGSTYEYDSDDDNTCCEHFLLIGTFSVEEVADANVVVGSQKFDEDDLGKLPPAVEKVFVKVDVKDMYAYRKEAAPGKYYNEVDFTCVSACVL